MTNPTRTYAPYVVAGVLLLVMLFTELHTASVCNGTWVFALDDSYIHLAMGRNLAEHGTWGATPDQFSATSSAPLYTLLLAGAFLTGMQSEIWAWIFAALGGVIAAFLLTRRIEAYFPRTATAVALGLGAAIAIWLPEIMATGMEHTLHISAILIVMILLESILSGQGGGRTSLWFVIAVFVAAGLRYETMFLLPPICWLLWRLNNRRLAIMVLVAGVLPAIVLGIMYASNGAMFLPNSVLLKGVDIEGGLAGHITRLLRQLDEPSRLILLVIAAFNIFDIARRKEKSGAAGWGTSAVFIVVLVAHAALARPDRRYLGYLLALGIWAAIPALQRWYSQGRTLMQQSSAHNRSLGIAFAALVVVAIIPFTDQVLDLGRLPKLGQDIYAQQYQTARFLSTAYSGQRVGLNDIGTTAWAGKNPILDFWGLGDNEVARLRLSGELTPERMNRLARDRDVKVVAIYSHWFLRDKGLPEQWELVGRWQIPGEIQVNAASNSVDFFATSPDAIEPLRRNLQAFSSQLPANVKVIM